MVGFPGETDADFEELMDFVRWARFERMGAFAYSEEEGTYSALHYPDNIPDEVKQDRLSRLMALQQEISAEIEAEKVGQTLRVVIDRKEGDYYEEDGCSPVGDYLEHPHQRSKREEGDDTLLAQGQAVDAQERGGNAPQEERNQEYDWKKNAILHIEFLLPSCFNCVFSHF
jgi:hypothetical protein